MIRITAKHNGFRRCGVAHSSVPVEYEDDRFTAAEKKVLMAEPWLVVEVIKDTEKTNKGGKGGKKDDDKPGAGAEKNAGDGAGDTSGTGAGDTSGTGAADGAGA